MEFPLQYACACCIVPLLFTVNTFMPNGEVTTDEIMEFLQEHVVTKEDLRETEKRLDGRMDRLENRMDHLEAELALIHQDLSDIKARLDRLEKRTKEDADASAREVTELRKRVEHLELQVAELHAAHA